MENIKPVDRFIQFIQLTKTPVLNTAEADTLTVQFVNAPEWQRPAIIEQIGKKINKRKLRLELEESIQEAKQAEKEKLQPVATPPDLFEFSRFINGLAEMDEANQQALAKQKQLIGETFVHDSIMEVDFFPLKGETPQRMEIKEKYRTPKPITRRIPPMRNGHVLVR